MTDDIIVIDNVIPKDYSDHIRTLLTGWEFGWVFNQTMVSPDAELQGESNHAGFNHLFFNMLTLVFLGTMLERQIDGKSFGIIYLLSAFGGLLINEGVNYLNAFHLGGSLSIVLGASGAVSGIVAALATYAPNQEVRLIFPPIPVKMKWLALVFLVMDLRGGVSGVSDGVAHWVHIGGMATGFLLMKFWYLRK